MGLEGPMEPHGVCIPGPLTFTLSDAGHCAGLQRTGGHPAQPASGVQAAIVCWTARVTLEWLLHAGLGVQLPWRIPWGMTTCSAGDRPTAVHGMTTASLRDLFQA